MSQLDSNAADKDAALAVLESAPGVKRVVLLAGGEGTSPERLAFVELDPEAVNDAEVNWTKVWEMTYRTRADQEESDFTGWNSLYQDRPIPDDEMQAWVEQSVKRVLHYAPRRVLEIGCGSGLLLYRLAPHCERYAALEPVADMVERLRSGLAKRSGFDHVEVMAGTGLDTETAFDGESFDLIVLNSVVQYFPSAPYLERVLELAASRLTPSGRIYLGDIRNFQLLELRAISVELPAAKPTDTAGKVLRRVREHLHKDRELLVGPRWFSSWARTSSAISAMTVQPGAMPFDNEMNRFRCSVVLHRDPPTTLPGPAEEFPLNGEMHALETLLREGRRLVRSIPNPVLAQFEREWDAVRKAPADCPIGEIRFDEPGPGVSPSAALQLAQRLGAEGQITASSAGIRSHYDLTIHETPPALALGSGADSGPPECNDPRLVALRNALPSRLRSLARQALPPHLIPKRFLIFDRLPTSETGDIDKEALLYNAAASYA